MNVILVGCHIYVKQIDIVACRVRHNGPINNGRSVCSVCYGAIIRKLLHHATILSAWLHFNISHLYI